MNFKRIQYAGSTTQAAMTRRAFLKVTSAAGAGLTLGIFDLDAAAQTSGPGKPAAAAAAGQFAPNAFLQIAPDNTVTVLVKHVELGQALHRVADAVAEELDAAWSQIKVVGASRRPTLREHDLARLFRPRRPGYRRLDRDGEFVRAIPASRCGRARDAGRRRGGTMEGAVRRNTSEKRRRVPCERQEGDVRRACRRRIEASRAAESEAQGCQGLRLHRKARAANRRQGEVERYRAVYARRQAARDAHRGCCASAQVRRQGQELRRHRCPSHSGRPLRHRSTQRRRGIGDRLLGGEKGPRRAQDRVGRERCVQGLVARHSRRIHDSRKLRARSRNDAMRRRRSRAQPSRWKARSNFRISPTRQWNR